MKRDRFSLVAKIRIKHIFFISIFLILFSSFFIKSYSQDYSILNVVTCPEDEPFTYMNNGKISGFEIELIEKFSNRINKKLHITQLEIRGLIPALQSKKADIAISVLNKTEQRAKQVLFSKEYAKANFGIVVRKKDNIKTLNDLRNKFIVAKIGTSQYQYLFLLQKQYNFNLNSRQSSNNLMMNELMANRIDAFICMETQAIKFTKKYNNMEYFVLPIKEKDLDIINVRAIFPKNSQYIEQFNKMIDEMKQSKELDKLFNKYMNSL
jgi:ABC-type amino acid transport substrate-binding protein